VRKRIALALAASGTLGAAVAVHALMTDRQSSRCAMWYAETGDEQYRHASAWTCYWAEWRHTAENMRKTRGVAVANAAERAAQQEQQVQRSQAASVEAQQEAKVIEELREPVCAALAGRRHTAGLLEVDLVGLSGHASIFSVNGVCRDCPDEMRTYFDATGARFCYTGGKGGKMCTESKAFPHTGSVHREGTADVLWSGLGCR
jgi:hypothetical protein